MKTYRGFESLPHRQIRKKAQVKYLGFFLIYTPDAGRVENPRLGFDKTACRFGPPTAARRVSGDAYIVNYEDYH
ncbi:hypothetical protein C6H68_01405 [Photorhabdus luminescens]|nr:hypothetical protein C6H68_01405 [Photorhabdus luminescens]